jgi:hypothetical protein
LRYSTPITLKYLGSILRTKGEFMLKILRTAGIFGD